MQPQVNPAAPALTPDAAPARPPRLVSRPPQSSPSNVRWFLLAAAVLLAGLAIYWFGVRRPASERAKSGPSPAVRTAAVYSGALAATVRLTGVTAAENFSSILSPPMRGSRSGFGRDQSSASSSSSTPTTTVTSNASNSNASTSSSATGSSGNLSSALRASTSRIASSGSSTSSNSTSSAAASSTASTTMGSTGLGSTGGSLDSGSGGGGGGGNDFMLVLQKVAKPGVRVKKGEVIAEFDRQYMLLRLDDYRASVTQAEASLRKLKADLEVTRKAHDQTVAKAKAALDKAKLDMKTLPVLSDMDAARTKLAVEEAEAKYKEVVGENRLVEISLASQIRNAEIEAQQTRIELKRAEANADRMLIKAPIEGVTVMQTIFRGGDLGQVQAGDQLFPGMMFMNIVDTRSMVINANVNQADVERLRIGARAKVRFDAYPDLELNARVYSLGAITRQGGQRASFVKEIPVKLKLEQVDPRVIPDLSVSADIIVESEPQQASIVPLGSIFQDQSGRPAVFVQTPEGWTRREVELGVASNTHAAVRGGLKPGEIVALDRPTSGSSAPGHNN